MADEPVTLEQVKDHLRISPSQTAQDNYLNLLIRAARRSIENDIGRTIFATHPDVEAHEMPVIQEAALLLIGQWFWNREAVSEKTMKEIPNAVGWLLWPLKTLRI
jgi:uncharacterized phage protein (predicted DNA packaging)